MVMNALACGKCGAGLPPPDVAGTSSCVYCGTEHRDRSSEVLAGALPYRPIEPPRSSVTVVARSSWEDGEEAARIPMTEEAVLELVRQHFGGAADSVFVCPHVPPQKEQAARRAHAAHLPARERILALYDATRSGAGDEGFVVTARRLSWKNAGEPAASVQWREVDPDRLYVDGGRLYVGDEAISIAAGEDSVLDACANAFHVLALSGLPPRPRASGRVLARDTIPEDKAPAMATPPPAYTTSYHAYATHAETQSPDRSCWHCHTPLYESTPQCAFCGARPKKKGWLQTG